MKLHAQKLQTSARVNREIYYQLPWLQLQSQQHHHLSHKPHSRQTPILPLGTGNLIRQNLQATNVTWACTSLAEFNL